MSDKAAIKLERGTKRTCQDPDCGARFYDLNRDPIACPVCNTAYVIALQPPQPSARLGSRPLRKPAPVPHAIKEVPTEEGELAALEGEEPAPGAEDDDTLIEEVEEDATDMSDIVDAPAAGEDGKE